MNTEQLQPGCPWYDLSQVKLPNVKWCEENLCAWVVNPANTWSNFAYLILGFYLMMRGQKAQRKSTVWLGGAMIFMGLGSLVYHASYTFVLQVLDFLGMYVFLILVLMFNFVRLGWLKVAQLPVFYFVAVVLLTLLTTVLGWYDFPIQIMIPLVAVAMLWTEVKIQNSQSIYKAANLNYVFYALLFIIIAAVFSGLDVSRKMCDPENHFLQGHALWHLFSAVGLTVLTLHHEKTKEIF